MTTFRSEAAACFAARAGHEIDDATAAKLVRCGYAHPRQKGVRRLALTDEGRALADRFQCLTDG